VPWPTPTSADQSAPFGLGTAPLGNLFQAVDEAVALATVHRGVDAGAVVVDTAPYYGSGLSESRVGAAWAAIPADTRPLLSSKVGRILVPGQTEDTSWDAPPPLRAVFDWSEAGITSAFESSLERLGVDRLDICLAHDADEHEAEVLATGFPAMRKLQEQGLVTAIGSGMNQAEMLERFIIEAGIDVILLAGRWTLVDHFEPARRLLDRCLRDDVGVMLGGVLNSGLLAGGSTFNYVTAPPELIAKRDAIAARCREHDVTLEHAAIRFSAGHPAVSAVLVGARQPSEVDAAVVSFEKPVPVELWEDLRRRGLIDPSLPDPM
jgi:D-threo-aldose 1-dehydrogenase